MLLNLIRYLFYIHPFETFYHSDNFRMYESRFENGSTCITLSLDFLIPEIVMHQLVLFGKLTKGCRGLKLVLVDEAGLHFTELNAGETCRGKYNGLCD